MWLTEGYEPEEGIVAEYSAQIPVETAIVWLFYSHAVFLLAAAFFAKLYRCQLHWDQVEMEAHESRDYHADQAC